MTRRSRRWKAVISFADPSVGHRGVIYKAGNWLYAGRTDDLPKQTTLFTDKPKEPGAFFGTQAEAVRNAIEKLSTYPNDPVAKALGVSPRTWDNYKSGARKPPQSVALRLIALSMSLPATPPSDFAQRTRPLNEFIRLQSEKGADANSDARLPPILQTAREIIGKTGLRRYAELAEVDAGSLSKALNGKRAIPDAWLPKLEAANQESLKNLGDV